MNQLSNSRSHMTRLYFELVSRYHDNISPARMHSAQLLIYESAVLQLSKQEAILSAHLMYQAGKTVLTLKYNCLPEAHSFKSTEHSRYFHL